MEKEKLLMSKIDFFEETDEAANEKKEIKERNNYYQELISNYNEPIPLILNPDGLCKINSKDILEEQILKSDKHPSTLILEYKINKEFIFELLKNYELFNITEEESKFLLQKYFSDTNITQTEEVIDLNNDLVIDENEIDEDEIEEEIEDEIEEEIEDEFEDENITVKEKNENEEKLKIIDKNNLNIIKDKGSSDIIVNKESNIKKNINKVKNNDKKKIYSTMKLSSMASLDVENFNLKKDGVLEKNNMNKEKISEAKLIKQNINIFLRNALENHSGIDKKKTIIQFLHKNNFKNVFSSSFFDMKDEYGEPLFGNEIIDEWFDAINTIEEKQKSSFECSQLLITLFFYGIEWSSNKFGIDELKNICSEIKDPSKLPKTIEDTKSTISSAIDRNLPNNIFMNLLFFIGNVYIKNKTGLNGIL